MNEPRRPARSVVLDGRRVSYTIQESRTARKCRIRVSPAGSLSRVMRRFLAFGHHSITARISGGDNQHFAAVTTDSL